MSRPGRPDRLADALRSGGLAADKDHCGPFCRLPIVIDLAGNGVDPLATAAMAGGSGKGDGCQQQQQDYPVMGYPVMGYPVIGYPVIGYAVILSAAKNLARIPLRARFFAAPDNGKAACYSSRRYK